MALIQLNPGIVVYFYGCLADLHINWCLNIKYEHLMIQYFYCMSIYYSSSVCKLSVKDQDYCRMILKPELNPL